MKNFHHPNIVRLIEEFETESEIYLVLEYIKVSVGISVLLFGLFSVSLRELLRVLTLLLNILIKRYIRVVRR